MKLFKNRKKAEPRQVKDEAATEMELRRALYAAGRTAGNRNPMSKGQGYSGDTKAAILQMLREDE